MQKETYVAPKLEKQEPLQDMTTQMMLLSGEQTEPDPSMDIPE